MRITVHNAENQQRFAIALTLTQKWLTTKSADDVVRRFGFGIGALFVIYGLWGVRSLFF